MSEVDDVVFRSQEVLDRTRGGHGNVAGRLRKRREAEVMTRVGRVLAAGPPAAVLLYTLAPDLMAGWVSAPHPAAMPFLEPRTRALPAYGRLTGRGGTANVEAVLAAKPDLIVDSGSLGPTYASLADRVQAQAGIPYILLDGSLAKTPEAYRQLGAALGRQSDADALAAEAQRLADTVERAVAAVPEEKRPRVYYARGPRGLETGFAGSINTELVEAGWNRIVPPLSSGAVAEAVLGARGRVGQPVSPYGKGEAAETIVATLARELGSSTA